jgi:protein-S-isoprenylcysteine O-methyltransferase Ste14
MSIGGQRFVNFAVDYGERLFLILLSAPFLVAFVRVLPSEPYFIALAIAEMLSVFFVLIRKPGAITLTPYAVAIALIGTAVPLLARPGGTALLPIAVTSTLMFGGLLITILAKVALNRSFGLVAANRGVKNRGPYRIVRHPMYLGYFLTEAGFLLGNFNLQLVALYAVAWTAQILRVLEEERILGCDPAYAAYSKAVSFRVVPGLF